MTKGTEVIHRFLQRAAADNTFLVSNGEHLIAGNEGDRRMAPRMGFQITAANQPGSNAKVAKISWCTPF